MIETRLDDPRDVESAQRIVAAFKGNWWFNEASDELKVRRYINNGLLVSYLCTHNGRITEGLTRVIFIVDHDRTKVEMPNMIGGVWVDYDYRGTGIGRGLIEAVEKAGRFIHIPEVFVGGVDNPGFWLHLGYSQIGQKEFYKRLA